MRANSAKMHSDSSGEQLLELCTCPSGHNCDGCKIDDKIRAESKGRALWSKNQESHSEIPPFSVARSNLVKLITLFISSIYSDFLFYYS